MMLRWLWATMLLVLLAAARAQNNSSCLNSPQDSSCGEFTMPSSMVTTDVSKSCDMMPNMIGCSLQSYCAVNAMASKSLYCTPFAILKTLCLDMPMTPCNDYLAMCPSDTAVRECNITVLATGSTISVHSQITSICKSMPGMDGCVENCYGDDYSKCDLLVTYAKLCMQMPSMSQCSIWHEMCTTIPNWSLCTQSRSTPPEMRMYFHNSIRDYILFKFAVPESTGLYLLALILVALASVIHECLKYVHMRLEKRWKQMKTDGYVSINDPRAAPEDFMLKVDVPRALMRALQFTISYLLMLIVMSFNIGICLAVVFGIFLGNLLVGRHLVASQSDCCN